LRICTRITEVRWCSRNLPLHRVRRTAKMESALIFNLTPKTSALRNIIEVASKMLVPLGTTKSLESDNCSNASSVALADLKFSWARRSIMLTFSRLVRILFATCVCVSPVVLSCITCHCLAVSMVLGDLNLVNPGSRVGIC
jgi:hypothetical protein